MLPETPLQLMAQLGSGLDDCAWCKQSCSRRPSRMARSMCSAGESPLVRCIQPLKERLLAPPEPLRRFAPCVPRSRGNAPAEAVLTPPAVLLDRALVFKAGKDRPDGALRPGAV